MTYCPIKCQTIERSGKASSIGHLFKMSASLRIHNVLALMLAGFVAWSVALRSASAMGADAQLCELGLPHQATVTVRDESTSIGTLIKSMEKQSGIRFQPAKTVRAESLDSILKFKPGNVSLFECFEKLATANLRVNEKFPGIAVISNVSREVVGTTQAGPVWIVASLEPTGKGTVLFCLENSWFSTEAEDVKLSKLVAFLGDDKPAPARLVNVQKGKSSLQGVIDDAALTKWPSKLTGTIDARVATRLIQIDLPLGANATIKKLGFTATTNADVQLHDGKHVESFNVAWDMNVPPDRERHLQDLASRVVKGDTLNPDDERALKEFVGRQYHIVGTDVLDQNLDVTTASFVQLRTAPNKYLVSVTTDGKQANQLLLRVFLAQWMEKKFDFEIPISQ